MVQYVTHTGRYTVLLQKKIEELFTLSPELPLLANLVFWLYFIVSQVALLFLHQDSKICDTKQSIDKN